MSIWGVVDELVEYGIDCELVEEEDRIYVRNRILGLIGADEYETGDGKGDAQKRALHEILSDLCDYAVKTGACPDDSITYRDIFDTELMAVMTDKPSVISAIFWELYKESPKTATDWFYQFSCDTNYIRKDRIAKDKKWTVETEYGTIDISINLSKPEKDPKAIAAARNATEVAYPACQLCIENEGYKGRLNHPARGNHRIIPITVNDGPWGFQYSPYVYYNEHCIVLNAEHVPMKIDEMAFRKLFSFVEQFPHYFLGSNADLPIVGGSILAHDHFQGGHYTFAMERAGAEKSFTIPGFEEVSAAIVKWPLSVIRLNGKDKERLIKLSAHILNKWRSYTDEDAFIFAETDGEPHNTITPIVRMRDGNYEIDLALRNNITTDEHPLGVYHPHAARHNIKKENIGLIEVMGLAVLPARLNHEMDLLADCLASNKPVDAHEELIKHVNWVDSWKQRAARKSKTEVEKIIEEEIGLVFTGVLEDAGVYKCTPEGRKAFMKFINSL